MIYTDQTYMQNILYTRKRDSHKGDYGKVLIYAGSCGMAGAAILCGRAALRCGAGLVQYLLPDLSSPLLSILQISVPEATCIPAYTTPSFTERLDSFTSIACGSGLGKGEDAHYILEQILRFYGGTLLLDADALNMISESESLAEMTCACKAAVIITPHIGEARRLLHSNAPIADQKSREEAALELSRRYRCIAVLKGAGTLVAKTDSSGQSLFQNTTGNPGMATAGSGDSLAGIITSLAAQGYSPLDAARMGVFIHGKAGDLAAGDLGEMGLISSDIVSYIPCAIKSINTLS